MSVQPAGATADALATAWLALGVLNA